MPWLTRKIWPGSTPGGSTPAVLNSVWPTGSEWRSASLRSASNSEKTSSRIITGGVPVRSATTSWTARRIASDSEFTRIGLPETQLGLIPGWGGSTRLPRLIGVPRALDLIVRGKTMKAPEAKRAGLVHEVTAQEHLDALARRFAMKTTSVNHHHLHLTQLWPVPQLLRIRAKAGLFAKF